MPSLSHLALRYLIWLIALRAVLALLQQLAGLPDAVATGVILAAAPMAEIGLQAVRRAGRPLALADWSVIWAMCTGIFVLVQVVVPALLSAPMRTALATAAGLTQIGTVILSTAVMGAIFLLIGARATTGPGR
jgi:predicted secreted protein